MRPRHAPTIALLLDYLVSNYQMGLLRAVQYAAKERGVNLITAAGRSLHCPRRPEAVQNRIYELFDASNVDAVIVAAGCLGNDCGPELLMEFLKRYRPLPVCAVGMPVPGVPSLVISNRQGSRVAVEHLLERHGASRIAYIAGPSASVEARERRQGYLDALRAHDGEIDPMLEVQGDFTTKSGLIAAQTLFDRDLKLDGVAAANDYMALAVLEIARQRGIHVPRDLFLVGFDDAPFARFALPSLTTVRQPLTRLGRTAVDYVLSAMDGAEVPLLTEVEVTLMRRQSCGCGLASDGRRVSVPALRSSTALVDEVAERREALAQVLNESVGVPADAFGGWASRIVDSIHEELSGSTGRFLSTLESILDQAQTHAEFADEFVKVVGILRTQLFGFRPELNVALDLEQLWHGGQAVVCNAATNAQGKTKLDLELVISNIRVGFERIATALSLPALKQAVVETLPDINIHDVVLGLFEDAGAKLAPLVAMTRDGRTLAMDAYDAKALVPRGFFPDTASSHIALPLTFNDECYGIVLMAHTTIEAVYTLVRDQVSSALKGAALHRAAIKQSALLEQLERQRLKQEAVLAARIQTDILPKRSGVDGLEISAKMIPAAEVGGDYYDIIPCENGCWLGIGDVTGHGLMAGLLMMMIQSMVAALVHSRPDASPRDIVIDLNAVLYANIRHRLGRDEQASLMLLRYERSGRLTFAGYHEEFLVYRSGLGVSELITPPGIWVGVLADISAETVAVELQLNEGDFFVLYSDGVLEALNDHGEQFGTKRLKALVDQAGSSAEPSELIQLILDAVDQWQPRQRDDVTVLVARQASTAPHVATTH